MKNFAIKFKKGTYPEEVKKVMQTLKEKYGLNERDDKWNIGQLEDRYYTKNGIFHLVYFGSEGELQIHSHAAGRTIYTVDEIFKYLDDINQPKFYLKNSPELKKYFATIGVNNNSGRLNKTLLKDSDTSAGIDGNVAGWVYYQEYGKWTCSQEVPSGYTLITLDQLLNQQPKNQTDMSTTTNKPALSITKTDTVIIGKKKREITITVLTTDFGRIRAGYSVRNPEDKKSDPTLAKQISTGRALNDKTTLVNYEFTKDLNKKFILYAIAEQLFRELNSGKIQIKGIK